MNQSIFSKSGFHTLALPLGAVFFSIKELISSDQHVFIVSDNKAEKISESLSSLYDNVLYYPAIELMPYSQGMPSLDLLAARMRVLSLLQKNEKPYIIVLNYKSFVRALPPVSYFKKSLIKLYTEKPIKLDDFCSTLESYGYTRTSIVREVGEFALKNRIIDIFPSDEENPIRLITNNDEIVRIASFDKDTQLSEGSKDSFYLAPLAEFLFPKEKNGFQDPFHNPIAHSNFIEFYHTSDPITNYVNNRAFATIFTERPEIEDNKIRAVYQRLKAEKLLIESINDITKNSKITYIIDPSGITFKNIRAQGNFSGGFSGFVVELEKLFETQDNLCVCFFAEYTENARRIAIMLRRFHPKIVSSFHEIPSHAKGFYIITSNWEFGFFAEFDHSSILFIGETDISGKKKAFRKRLKQTSYAAFDEEISPGDSVVHLNYGIGIFRGIERIKVLDKEKDYILIEYADKQKLFVPLEQADLIGRYTGGADGKKTKIDSLTSKTWQKKRSKAQEEILKFAKQLVESHAKRITLEGFAFPPDGEEQKAFEDKFSYIETPDQIRVIEEIKEDMEEKKPMDRLLCGDVGFGKTEIALRAAFKAVYAGKQAALLAPTTILAEQHYFTCLERFKDFPVRMALLTRFTENEERKEILHQLENQDIDLIIGTHAILSKDIRFKALGLLIIDEEHKFGVVHKEKIKAKHPLTDILSLSATPIPRTLSLALGNLRSFSTLQTPPDSRIPIETIVSDFQNDIVRDAVRNELDRGGQIYFIQNKIKDLDKYADLITELVPEASVVTAHGQMTEEELEDAFLGFMRGFYNVLVATTIVESGLDIPNANTIIVSDAQRLGLSQLYQLKGRVGRSNKQAYAYFLSPEHKNITETATKRLDALSEYTELGSGFHIAKKDLEIRGAGNILGEEQHGHLIAIGYDLYMKLLREEVQKLQGTNLELTETLIDLAYDAFIPDTYINDPSIKMEVYRRIVSVKKQKHIEKLKKEIQDRFGEAPPEIETLFEIAKLKIEASKIGINSITEKTDYIEITFSNKSKADPLKVLEIAQNGAHPVNFSPYNPHLLKYETFDAKAEQKVRRLTSFIRDIS